MPAFSRATRGLWIAVVVLTAAAGCSTGATTPTAPEQAATEAQRVKDRVWARAKDCADQAERAARRQNWVEGGKFYFWTSTGYTNHYSPKYDRCYVAVSYSNEDAKANPGPTQQELLFDAFENRLLATCSSSASADLRSFYCNVGDNSEKDGDCGVCGEFIKEHLDN